MDKFFDVIVVGAGHAGCEAAAASARFGADTLLITLHLDHIAQMSCNPAIGGIAKGQLVREIDALGGVQGIIAEVATIQFRLLNRGKGPAVWSPRAQCDKLIYQRAMKYYLENIPNLHLFQAEVQEFIVNNGKCEGVVTQFGDRFFGKSIVLTTGTFLRGKLHYGLRNFGGGRAGDFPANALSSALENQLKLKLGRLKTGTPPRISAKSMDFAAMELQTAEQEIEEFSYWPLEWHMDLPTASRRNLPCYMTHSTLETAQIVKNNLSQSPMYTGVIKGIGTRYCPSFEDKVRRFPQHPVHLLFLEPEGSDNNEYYINGLSSSLPPDVQTKMVHSIPGLIKAELTRYAYAIEYDYIPSEQTERTMQNKKYENLFTAGQINGTSGYEEAAGQGVIAGMNAARNAANLEVIAPSRNSSYLGVMLDDLSTKEIVEPYRLFTSRAEYRLLIRQENADLRLTEWGYNAGIVPECKYRRFVTYRNSLNKVLDFCHSSKFHGQSLLSYFNNFDVDSDFDKTDLPFCITPLIEVKKNFSKIFVDRIWRELLIEAKYEGYLSREKNEIERMERLENFIIPSDFDYNSLVGLSIEAKQKLLKRHPTTLGQAGRIDGVTPADTALLQIAIRK